MGKGLGNQRKGAIGFGNWGCLRSDTWLWILVLLWSAFPTNIIDDIPQDGECLSKPLYILSS